MIIWQYQFLSVDLGERYDEIAAELDQAGEEGWEVVSLVPLTWDQPAGMERTVKPDALLVLMKRPKPE
jgi:hypothetical protein